MHAARPGDRGQDTDGGEQLRPDPRPFRSWSQHSLESELDRTAAWLKARLVAFASTWDLPPVHPGVPPDFGGLRTIMRVVIRETRRLEAISDELRLRRRWFAAGQSRAQVEEEWRVNRTGDHARVTRVE
jgi:hypothetical protein